MDEQQILLDINSGKKRVVGKWEYLFNYWSPIFALIGMLVAGLLWFANAEGRVFSNAELRVKTEEYITNPKSFMNPDYVTREELHKALQEYYEIARENRADIKEILKYLRK